MKLLISSLFLISPYLFAASKTLDCQGSYLMGAQVTVTEGSLFSSGRVVLKDGLPSEFEWTGKEPSATQADLKARLETLKSNKILGAENLPLVRNGLKTFTSNISKGVMSVSSLLYIEEGLLNGSQNNGIIAVIKSGRVAGVVEETTTLISKCVNDQPASKAKDVTTIDDDKAEAECRARGGRYQYSRAFHRCQYWSRGGF